MPNPDSRFEVNASWLIKLRWVAVVGQILTIAFVVSVLQIRISMFWALAVVIGLTAFSNLVLSLLFVRASRGHALWPGPTDRVPGVVMVMDLLSLTALLFATGGPTNPFCLFYFVNLSLSAVLLRPAWAWSLTGLSLLCFAGLMWDHHPIEGLDLGYAMSPIRERGGWSLYQVGLLTAFGTCATVIVYFMARLSAELREQEEEVQRAEVIRARSEKLEALGTLAAGTAHELATPLSTIAVVARDVEKALDEHPPDFPGADEVIEDIHLIRSQLERCRGILDRMASHSGQAIGESLKPLSLPTLVEEVLAELPQHDRVVVSISPTAEEGQILIPRVQLSQAIRGLVQNALDADPDGGPVEITIDAQAAFWRWQIADRGSGMTADVLERVSEPFFTTKSPGKGMGLGVFLAQNVITRLGGRIQFHSTPLSGTRVTIHLPRETRVS